MCRDRELTLLFVSKTFDFWFTYTPERRMQDDASGKSSAGWVFGCLRLLVGGSDVLHTSLASWRCENGPTRSTGEGMPREPGNPFDIDHLLRFEDGWGGCQGGLTTEPEDMGQERWGSEWFIHVHPKFCSYTVAERPPSPGQGLNAAPVWGI